MGISFSCPFANYSDVETGLESMIVNSISFGDEQAKTPLRSVSFNSTDLEPTILKSIGSGKKMTLETSVSFKGSDLDKIILVKVPSLDKKEQNMAIVSSTISNRKQLDSQYSKPLIPDPASTKHMAALKLQKVYKSFRTRRKLADCAVLVEQSWWKLLDFAELKRSSISFFDIEKHETAISRWSRARTRAAKVGKGLSKNDKAQKLALQHWLEAIDPRHRYGHNLHFYYDKWLHCQSREPFFYWLDIGEGREVNLEKCSRSKLQQQCIKYLGPMERMAYEVVLEDGKFYYKQSGEQLHTSLEGKDAKWIFVLSTSKVLYVGKKKKGTFQHSSFLAGGATTAAGRLVVENGILKAVWPHSGHYRPTEQNFNDFVAFLKENDVELKDVQMSPVDEEDDALSKQRSSLHMRSNSSDEDLSPTLVGLETEETNAKTDSTALEPQRTNRFLNLNTKLTNLEIPKQQDIIESFKCDEQECLIQENMFDEQEHDEENEVENVPEESILKRINSRKGMNSYQLGKQLSCKWTTGAGPRIGCVRDYPSELQFRALEKVNLSPRGVARSRSYFSPKIISGLSPNVSTPTDCSSEEMAENSLRSSVHHSRVHSSPLIRKV
ncbi:hypothetical protein G4B88_026919 [Cannabis sativa]|uniref:IQ domain-containing protein IQM2-like n=1 Tax=Cannabis sativa TaxID=3483 RepID=A0A7J6EIJ4_CANSA|nr:hypothetical protein G4B88_026919 [Cannabis sativa]